MKKNKSYLDLANEKHEQAKKDKEARKLIELAKIEAQKQRQEREHNFKQQQAKDKAKRNLINILLSIVTFIILLIILLIFGKIISHT